MISTGNEYVTRAPRPSTSTLHRAVETARLNYPQPNNTRDDARRTQRVGHIVHD